MKVGNKNIGKNHPTYIIAEIGINHNGIFEIAKNLIIESAKAGVDAVKFQKRDAPSIMISSNINENPIEVSHKDEYIFSNKELKILDRDIGNVANKFDYKPKI